MEINNNTFIITGGASGLGEATAKILHEAKGKVVILDMNEEKGKTVADKLDGLFVKADVTNEADVQQVIDQTVETYGSIDGVVNCAGFGMSQRVVGKDGPFPLDIFNHVLQVNLVGTFNVTRLAAEKMIHAEPNDEGERGVIINTASAAATDGQIGQAAYSAAKAGVAGMTLPIARELAQFGVRVMTISPGLFDTPMFDQATPEIKDALGKQIPFPPRLGQPKEYALLARSIIENIMLNGETIRLDGAIRMAPR